ncbi:MAG: flippase [Oscillospiraceae bacterium]|nr:flippase [Oscillospiraceae bacterium]
MASSIKKNFAYQMIYEVLILILPFITSPYIARVIGAEGLGIYSYSYSIAHYFVLFSMLGLKNYGNRAIAQSRNDPDEMNSVFSSILLLHILLSVFFLLVYLIYAFSLKEDRIYALIQTAHVMSGLFDISWFFFGIEKFKLTVTRNVIIRLLTIAGIFAFVRTKEDLPIYCAILAFSNLIGQLSLWLPLRKYVRFVKTDWAAMQVHIKPMLILFIPAIAVSLYKYMDKIMLGGSLGSKEQLGFYENAEKVINMPITIIGSFGTVMLPKMSNLAIRSDKTEARKYMSVSMKYIMCLAFALAFGIAGIGTTFAPMFWGDKFYTSGVLIMELAVTIPFISFANVIRTQYLIPTKKDKEYLSSVVAGAVVNLITNQLLIPHYGAGGATIGTILAETVVCLIQAFVVRKELPLLQFVKSFLLFPLMGAFMFAVVYLIGQNGEATILTLLTEVITGVSIYGTLAVIYFFLTKEETFMKMINKLKKHA